MPHPISTRLLGIAVLFLGFSVGLWPHWAPQMIGALIPMLLLFAYLCGRRAPVFDDRAFHRTLPLTKGGLLLSMLRLPLEFLTMLLVAIVAYCWLFNFSWRAMVCLAELTILPVMMVLAAGGIAGLAKSRRDGGAVWIWMAVLGAPLLGWGPLAITLKINVIGMCNPTWISASILGLLYLPVWWLIAVRKRWRLGLILTACIGAMMPLSGELGYLFRAHKPISAPPASAYHGLLTAERLPSAGEAWERGNPIMSRLLRIRGLKDNEYFRCSGFTFFTPGKSSFSDSPLSYLFNNIENSNGMGMAEFIEQKPGEPLWGRGAKLEAIRRALPAGMVARRWLSNSMREETAFEIVDERGAPVPLKTALEGGARHKSVSFGGEVIAMDAPIVAGVPIQQDHWLRLPQGGTLQIKGLRFYDAMPIIEMKLNTEEDLLSWASLRVPFMPICDPPEIYALVSDEEGKTAYLLRTGGGVWKYQYTLPGVGRYTLVDEIPGNFRGNESGEDLFRNGKLWVFVARKSGVGIPIE